MKTKVEPTVEKWERKPKNLEQAIINLYKNVFERGMKISEHNFVMAIEDLMTQYATHSVQEAKAEEMYKERNLWIVAIQSALFYGTNLKTLRNHLKGMLPDAPSKNKISDPQKNLPVESVSHIKAVNGERL